LYAASDEFHQLFVPGRSGEVKDVLIDSAGAVTGALLFYLALRLYENYRKTKIQSEECN
jgi:VanZ family protein